ncbi:MAG: DUF3987 domain-containing protein [Marinifilaceae bacterium]
MYTDANTLLRRTDSEKCIEPKEALPTFPPHLYNTLPKLLCKACKAGQSDQERDLLLLGSLVCLSSALPNTYGIYAGQRIYPNLFLFVSARASAGKSILNHCKTLVKPIHRDLTRESESQHQQFEAELSRYLSIRKMKPEQPRPQKPPVRMLFIPANNSATGMFQLLGDNDSSLLFETEGDTLAHSFKSDYGNYSDGFRKAFQHESISFFRRTDQEHVEIEHPKLSALLSGTPQQITNLIPSAENGLFSRFIFYTLPLILEWKNVFSTTINTSLENYFQDLGQEFYATFQNLQNAPTTEFQFSREQQERFNRHFGQWQEKYATLLGLDYMATVRRLGLITFRLAMILTRLRASENHLQTAPLICNDADYYSVMEMASTLIQHSKFVFQQLPAMQRPLKRQNQQEIYFSSLPDKFNRQEYLETARNSHIPEKTADKYIAKFCNSGLLRKPKHNWYEKM